MSISATHKKHGQIYLRMCTILKFIFLRTLKFFCWAIHVTLNFFFKLSLTSNIY